MCIWCWSGCEARTAARGDNVRRRVWRGPSTRGLDNVFLQQMHVTARLLVGVEATERYRSNLVNSHTRQRPVKASSRHSTRSASSSSLHSSHHSTANHRSSSHSVLRQCCPPDQRHPPAQPTAALHSLATRCKLNLQSWPSKHSASLPKHPESQAMAHSALGSRRQHVGSRCFQAPMNSPQRGTPHPVRQH